jgi:hypoxanthine phosphoribosyltransferase
MINDECKFTVDKILFEPCEIEKRVSELAIEINNYYKDKPFVIVCVLKGAFIFLADLIRKINLNFSIDFISASSYGENISSSGNILIQKDINMDIKDKFVLIVEDIVDTGNTLSFIMGYLYEKGSKEVKICSLLDKPSRRETKLDVDFSGFTVPNVFVVGYGLDACENYRNLPYIAQIRQN